MREQKIDLWEAHRQSPLHVAGIPTNGIVTSSGRLVMGAGVAKQARDRFSGLDMRLGRLLIQNNKVNRVFLLSDLRLFTFPTKLDWGRPAAKYLIRASANELDAIAQTSPGLEFYLPRPGCGLGKLDYTRDVHPLLAHLPDNVIVIDKP